MASTAAANRQADYAASEPAVGLSRPPALMPVEIATLQPGQRVDGLLACARKAILDTRGGDTFLVAALRDGHGQIQARAFEQVHELAGQFERGDVVHVRGRVITYRQELQIRLEHIARHALTQATGFLPVSRRSVDELDGYLEHLVREVAHPGYTGLLESLLSDPSLRKAWRTAPCTCATHHAYLGGLLEHTVAVATLAVETCSLHPRLNGDLLITAALVHDIGLIRSFTYRADIGESHAGRMLGHLELGIQILRVHAGRVQLAREDWLVLAHCVLAHHGPRSLLSREYACAEALALQRIVALDEGVKRALERGRMA